MKQNLPLLLLLATASVSVTAKPITLKASKTGDKIHVLGEGTESPLVVQVAEADMRPYLHPIKAPDGKGTLTQYSRGTTATKLVSTGDSPVSMVETTFTTPKTTTGNVTLLKSFKPKVQKCDGERPMNYRCKGRAHPSGTTNMEHHWEPRAYPSRSQLAGHRPSRCHHW